MRVEGRAVTRRAHASDARAAVSAAACEEVVFLVVVILVKDILGRDAEDCKGVSRQGVCTCVKDIADVELACKEAVEARRARADANKRRRRPNGDICRRWSCRGSLGNASTFLLPRLSPRFETKGRQDTHSEAQVIRADVFGDGAKWRRVNVASTRCSAAAKADEANGLAFRRPVRSVGIVTKLGERLRGVLGIAVEVVSGKNSRRGEQCGVFSEFKGNRGAWRESEGASRSCRRGGDEARHRDWLVRLVQFSERFKIRKGCNHQTPRLPF